MELLGGLAFLGHIMNKTSNVDTNKKKDISKKIYNNSGKNIYDNDTYKKVLNKMKLKARKKSQMANNPEKTGVIPPYYNSNRSYAKKSKFDPFEDQNMSDSDFSNDVESYAGSSCDSGSVNLGDPSCFFKKENKFNNNKYQNKILNNSQNNSFLNQFEPMRYDNPSDPVALNSVAPIIGDNGKQRLELERDMALNGGFSSFNTENDLTYGIVSKENFVHNNMVPFFKSKDGGFNPYTERKNAEIHQRKLESFSGSANNLEYRPKTERKTLFDPVAGLTNMYGTPALTDFQESRFIPGMERRNEKPFQEVRITPGLNLGYNEVGKVGFHDVFRVMPKTVDELRVASNPKITYGGVVIPGMKGQRSSVPSKMYKRRPLTFWETTPADYIRGQSYIKAPTIHAEVDSGNLATVNRGVDLNGRLGGAQFFTDLHKPEDLIEKTKYSLKENFKNDAPRNSHKQEANDARGHDDTYTARETMREIHSKTERSGQLGNSQLEKSLVFDNVNNIQEPTMRNIHALLDRAGNLGNLEFNKGHIYDSNNWIPDVNMRNIHEQTDRTGQMGNGEYNKGHTIDSVNWIPDPTMRNLYEKKDRAGNMGNNQLEKGYIFDGVNWIPDPNMRNLHEKIDRAGNMGNSQLEKGYIFDGVNWIPDPNMRNLHEKIDRAGNMGNSQLEKGYIFDGVNWIPDPNMRNLHEKTDRAGNMGNSQLGKGYIFDGVNWIPDPNMRNIHEKTDRAGNMGNNQLEKGYIYDGVNWIPDPTMRDIYSKKDRAGNIGNSQLDKPFVFDTVNNIPDPTMRDIHEKKDRVGNINNGELDKPFVFDTINNIPDPTMRDIHSKKDRVGVTGPNHMEKQRSRGDANNMRVNTVKEVIAQGRKPTDSNYSKGPTVSFTMMNLREPLNFNRDIYPDIKQTTTEKMGFIGTRSKQTLPQQSFHFYSHIDENLMGNQLINNVIHQSPTN